MTTNIAARLGEILRAPYAGYTPAALLEHFHTRGGVEYFPVIEPVEASRERIDRLLENEFEFAGERHRLAEPIDWLTNASADVEWHILLHKFYYAAGLGLAYHQTHDVRYLRRWVALTDSWIATTPPGFIAADVTGRRIQNWIYAHHYFVTRNRPDELCAQFYARFLVSLHEQVQWLTESLAPARNHRTLELYAIFLAATVFPEWRSAREWRERALAEIAENVRTDLLEDGVQCELSTDYHHIVLRNLLCVCRLARMNAIELPAAMEKAIVRALEFSMHVHQPTGRVPSFSDGDARDYRDLLAQGAELFGREDMAYVASNGRFGVPPAARSRGFSASGYYVMRSGWGEHSRFEEDQHVVIDCGPLGAGNHGHFDCLSFELAAHGEPLVVDPGRYTYDEGQGSTAGSTNWRAWFRGTAAHNTIVVDGHNQTRYEPGPKKMKVRGPAPEATVHAWVSGRDFDYFHGVAASHAYPVVHERVMVFVRPEYWLVVDFIAADTAHDYAQLFHLSPKARGHTVLERRDDMLLVEAPHLVIAQADADGTASNIEDGFVSERYGIRAAAPVARFARRATDAVFHAVLLPYRDRAPAIHVRTLPVVMELREPSAGGACALALAIRFGTGRGAYTDTWLVRASRSHGTCRFASMRTDGRFAFVREDAYGAVVRVHADPGGQLEEGGFPVSVDAGVGRIGAAA